MKIVGMKIENFKRIKFANLELDEHMNIVSGKNGAGKTSLVEALMGAIGGKTEMGKNPQRKIKAGADKAVVEVVLSDGTRKLNIKRTITEKDVYLKATTEDGSPVKQSDLDVIFDHTTINLMKLLNMSVTEQVEFMKRVGGINTDKVEDEYKAKFSERTVLNRTLKEAKITLDKADHVEKIDRVDVTELLLEVAAIESFNSECREGVRKLSDMELDIKAQTNEASEFAESVLYFERKLEEAKANKLKSEGQLKELIKQKDKFVKTMKSEKDSSEVSSKIKNAGEINDQARKYDEYLSLLFGYETASEKVDIINKEMTDLLAERDNIIKNGKLPFKNVSFDKERGVVINDIAFDDMSSAQQIRIMARIYIESNPGLKVIYIKDGSLLDPDTLKAMSEMSELKDYQFLVEIVQEQDESIIMRDGEVLGSEDPAADEREEV